MLRPHAQGGLGAVFVALDGELNREVALKEILGHHADDATTRLRFLLEAEITGGLEHPGIVPVYGLGNYADGRPYYAMRFIRGDSLKEAIAGFHSDESLKQDPGKRMLALRGLLGRLIDVCNAIGYAHARGVLHRDIKPSNIILGNHGETLVVDWGLAKAMGHHEPSGTDERTLRPSSGSGSADTLPGSAIGTPAYMSPEQAVGDVDHIGPPSDVYSLGGTLYCLLTGRTAHEGKDFGTILRDIHKGNFPAPRKLDASIPPALEAVCLKAMATRPEDRYPSCRALADDLECWLADEAVSAWREPWPVRARRWASRRRTLVTVAVGATALAAVVSTLSAWATARALVSERHALADMTKALAAEKVALQDATISEERSHRMVELFMSSVAEELSTVPGAEAIRHRLLEQAATYYDKTFKRGDGIFEHITWANSAYNVGRIRRLLGDDAKALESLQTARTRYRQLVERQPDYCNAWSMIGNCCLESMLILWGEQRLVEAEATGREGAKALAEADRLGDRNVWDEIRNGRASIASNLGLIMIDLGRLDEARRLYGEALELRREIVSRNPSNARFVNAFGSIHHNLAVLDMKEGRLAEARRLFGEAGGHYDRAVALEPGEGRYAEAAINNRTILGDLLRCSGDLEEADRSCEEGVRSLRALVARSAEVPSFRASLGWGLVYRGRVLAQLGRDRESAESSLAAIAAFEEILKTQPARADYREGLAAALVVQARSLGRLGQGEKGLEAARRAVSEGEALVKVAPDAPRLRDLLAQARIALGEALGRSDEGRPEGLEVLERAVADSESAVKAMPACPWFRETLARSCAASGAALKASGQADRARRSLARAVEAIRQASAASPESKPLKEALAELARERDELGKGLPVDNK